jgi:hypothetical protein
MALPAPVLAGLYFEPIETLDLIWRDVKIKVNHAWQNIKGMLTETNILLAVRIYNLAVAAFVFIGYLFNPKATVAEFFPDIAIHLWQACLTIKSPFWMKYISCMAQPLRMVEIWRRIMIGTSEIPVPLAVGDIGNHILNLKTTNYLIQQEYKAIIDKNIDKKKKAAT